MTFNFRHTAAFLATPEADKLLTAADSAALLLVESATRLVMVAGSDSAVLTGTDSGGMAVALSGTDSAVLSDELSFGTMDETSALSGSDSAALLLVESSELAVSRDNDQWTAAGTTAPVWTEVRERQNV